VVVEQASIGGGKRHLQLLIHTSSLRTAGLSGGNILLFDLNNRFPARFDDQFLCCGLTLALALTLHCLFMTLLGDLAVLYHLANLDAHACAQKDIYPYLENEVRS
jgi:hypothetical protein